MNKVRQWYDNNQKYPVSKYCQDYNGNNFVHLTTTKSYQHPKVYFQTLVSYREWHFKDLSQEVVTHITKGFAYKYTLCRILP